MVTGSRIWHMTHSTGLLRFVWVMIFFGDMMKSNNLYNLMALFCNLLLNFSPLHKESAGSVEWFPIPCGKGDDTWFFNQMESFFPFEKTHLFG